MDKELELKNRTKQFAVRVVRLFRALPRTEEARVVGKQLLRSATSVASNYRAVCRSRSKQEFVSNIGIVVTEMDETVFWLEFLVDTNIMPTRKLEPLLKEANELLAIFVSSQLTARGVNPAIRQSGNSAIGARA